MIAPPRLATWLLSVMLPRMQGREILGDLVETFHVRAARYGPRSARVWYWRQAWLLPLSFARESARVLVSLGAQEARFTLRGLLRRPGFGVVTVLTLGLAIGANTAIFSLVDGVLLEALPFPDPDRVVTVAHTRSSEGMRNLPSATGIQEVYAARAKSFEAIALYRGHEANLNEANGSRRIVVATVTPSLFRVLRAEAALGRVFTEAEGRPGSADVAILSHAFWTDDLGRAPDVLGREIRIDGVSRRVVGVMAEDFAFPGWGERLWIPLPIDPSSSDFGGFNYQSIGRLKEGMTPENAARELESLFPLLSERYPYLSPEYLQASQLAADVHPYFDDVVGGARDVLWVLMAVVGFVLLIACANVANLFLARAEGRHKEVAVRRAIGAGRVQLAVRFVTESGFLVAAGGALGLVIAWVGIDALKRIGAPSLPRIDGIGIDASVFGFTGAVVVLATLVFGALPAACHRKERAAEVLRDGTRGAIGGRARHRVRGLLVATQIALALVLLVASALMAGSLDRIGAVDPGFVADDVLTFRIPLPEALYPSWDAAADFHQELLDRIEGIAGVEAAGAVTNLPLSGRSGLNPISVEGRVYEPDELPPTIESRAVTPGYFEALGIPLLRGRMLERADAAARSGVVLLSQAVVDAVFSTEEPLQRRVAHSLPDPHDGWSTVVGVVGDVHSASRVEEPMGILYFAIRPGEGVIKGWLAQNMSYAVKTSVPPLSILPEVRRIVADMDPAVPVASPRLMETILRADQSEMGFALAMIGVAAGLGMLLAAVGLYGVVSYLTAQRTREIGVRVALGAERAAVRWMIVRQGMAVTAAGVGVGLTAAYLLSRFMETLLFEVDARDPLVFASVTALLASVSVAATWLPAARACRVDPVSALRGD